MSTDPAAACRRPVVLSVDDDVGIGRALRRCLRPLGVELVAVNSGVDGLDMLGGWTVDLVIADMRMPGMSGAEFLKEAARAYRQVPRILLTGYVDEAAIRLLLAEGHVSCWLAKPWDDEQLRATVAQHIYRTDRGVPA